MITNATVTNDNPLTRQRTIQATPVVPDGMDLSMVSPVVTVAAAYLLDDIDDDCATAEPVQDLTATLAAAGVAAHEAAL